MKRSTCLVIAVLLACAACSRRDPDVDKLQQQVDDLTEQLRKLEQQIAQQTKPHQPEAPVPEPPIMPAGAELDPSVPAACNDYLAAVEAYQHCDKAAPAAREAMQKASAQMRTTWHANMPEGARKSASDACATAAEALRSGAQAIGCPIAGEQGP